MAKYTVFYGRQIYEQWDYPMTGTLSDEVRNGCYIYAPTTNCPWYRGDFTPVLDEDVPKHLKMLILLHDL